FVAFADRCIRLEGVPDFPGLENRQGASPRGFESLPLRSAAPVGFSPERCAAAPPSFDVARPCPRGFESHPLRSGDRGCVPAPPSGAVYATFRRRRSAWASSHVAWRFI